MDNYRIEACVDTLDQAILAQTGGADQVELCANLDQEGLTPDLDLIKLVKQYLHIPLKVMIRPHNDSFAYHRQDMRVMARSIEQCLAAGVDHIVTGGLTSEGNLDIDLLQDFLAISDQLRITIHKVIDATPDPVAEVSRLRDVQGIVSVLTSGQAETALAGAENIRRMIAQSGDHLDIIAAGRITAGNLAEVHKAIGAPVYHGRRIVQPLL